LYAGLTIVARIVVLAARRRSLPRSAWLAQHQQKAQSIFRVPESKQVLSGAAPQ